MSGSDVGLLAAFGLAVIVGEWFRVAAPGLRASTPISSAAAFGFAFAAEIPQGRPVGYSWDLVVLVVAAAMTIGAAARSAAGTDVRVLEVVGRFAAVVVVALLFRQVYLGQAPGEPAPPDQTRPWERALIMLLIASVGVLADLLVTSARVLRSGFTAWRRRFLDEALSSFALSVALAVTGVLIAAAARPLGVVALPLFLIPVVLSLFAFRRYLGVRETYRQGIRALSRLTEVAGYTPAGHAGRVAQLAVAMGRRLAIPERELFDLESAALLHDIGQVALAEPIPGGATVLAAPADQRRIERDTVDIVRETGVLDGVAQILERHTTPYRQMREFGEEIPLTSRVLKVANAYDDLTGGRSSSRTRDAAVERIYLGLGYEYDPRVVDALLGVLRPTSSAD